MPDFPVTLLPRLARFATIYEMAVRAALEGDRGLLLGAMCEASAISDKETVRKMMEEPVSYTHLPYTARRFCIKYSKRIFFGTDFHPVESPDSYNIYYRILETDDEYFDYSLSPTGGQGRFKAYGLYLPRETLEDIYCGNFKRLFHIS